MAQAQIVISLDEESKSLLRAIRDRLPLPDLSLTAVPPGLREAFSHLPTGPAPATPPLNPTKARQNSIKRHALEAVLKALDGWIEGLQDNRDALQHRNCNRGEECWRQFSPRDIRTMINDAARELGIAEFPHPTQPKEGRSR